jgi:uncharacterized membrane protein
MSAQMKGILSATIVLIVFLALLPTIVTSVATAAATAGLSASAIAIVNLIPLVVVAGGIFLATKIAWDKFGGG